jgi:hypothetical protein
MIEMTAANPVILSAAKDLKINRCINSRSFVVCATQDDGAIDSTVIHCPPARK